MITDIEYIKKGREEQRVKHPIKYHPLTLFFVDLFLIIVLSAWLTTDFVIDYFKKKEE